MPRMPKPEKNPGCQSCKYMVDALTPECCHPDNSAEIYNYLTGIKKRRNGYCMLCNDNCKCEHHEKRCYPPNLEKLNKRILSL